MVATSISLDRVDLVATAGLHAQVESAFANACNLVTRDGQRFSLVGERVGNGPLNIVLGDDRALSVLQTGDRVTGDGTSLEMGPAGRVDLSAARRWNPVPDYLRLTSRPHLVAAHVAWLRQALPAEAPPASLAAQPGPLVLGASGSRPAAAFVQARAGESIADLLPAYRARDLAGIQAGARRLAGLGPGLTPAGDDWLAGWLVGLHALTALAPDRQRLPVAAVGQAVLDAAAGRTTGLSLAYLDAAAQGAAPQAWHDLMYALCGSDTAPVRQATTAILRRGATSGADMLAGFVGALSADLSL